MKTTAACAALMIAFAVPCVSQTKSATNVNVPSVWSIHSSDVPVANRRPYPVGVLTPVQTIRVRRIEAISNRGPHLAGVGTGLGTPAGDPIPCPLQYTLELTNGSQTETIPISNTFIGKKTTQTYTDSGPIDVEFSAGERILVSIVDPKPEFPPIACTFVGLDISVQYEVVAPKKIDESAQNPQ